MPILAQKLQEFNKKTLSAIYFHLINLSKNAEILVLNSYGGWKPAMIITPAGEQKQLACFERDDKTSAQASCSINWKNQLFIFGGFLDPNTNSESDVKQTKRQISRLVGNRLEYVRKLPFDHDRGTCSVMASKYVFLCFSAEGFKGVSIDFDVAENLSQASPYIFSTFCFCK